jgi:hypothetical protein
MRSETQRRMYLRRFGEYVDEGEACASYTGTECCADVQHGSFGSRATCHHPYLVVAELGIGVSLQQFEDR